MNKTLAVILTAASLLAVGSAQAADETPADQQQASPASTETMKDSEAANQAPQASAEAAPGSEASASSGDSGKQ